MTEKEKAMMDRLWDLFHKEGLVDFFYCGVDIEGRGYAAYSVGSGRIEKSNVGRVERLVGKIEHEKQILLKRLIDNGDENMEETNNE